VKQKIEQILVVLFLVGLPIILFFYTATKSEIALKGKVINFSGIAQDDRIVNYLIIKLEDNRTLTIRHKGASKFHVGKSVVILEKTSYLFDVKRYTLSRITNP